MKIMVYNKIKYADILSIRHNWIWNTRVRRWRALIYVSVVFHLDKSVSECPRTAAFSVNGVCPYLLFLSHWILLAACDCLVPIFVPSHFLSGPFLGLQQLSRGLLSLLSMLWFCRNKFRCLGDFHSPQDGFVIVCWTRRPTPTCIDPDMLSLSLRISWRFLVPSFISCFTWHLFEQNVILLLPKIFLNVVCASNLKNKYIIGNAFSCYFMNYALDKEVWFWLIDWSE